MTDIPSLTALRPERFDRPDILKQLNAASRSLAELKGVAGSMPNQGILISTLGLQEAKDSSEIENIITTQDELFRELAFPDAAVNAATKEVARYRQALRVGYEAVNLVKQGLLDVPVLYLSRHIVRTKGDYYRLLQEVRDSDNWEDWVRYLLLAVEHTAADAVATIRAIKAQLMDYKHRIRADYRFYSQDLINNLFSYPYTRIEFIERDLKVSRLTATRYLDRLVDGGFLVKRKVGRSNYYVNLPLYGILTGENPPDERA